MRLALLATLLVVVALWQIGDPRPGANATASLVGAPSLGEQLRYIGRDAYTGLPAPVDDRFISEIEQAVERYGKDERQDIPPPSLSGPTVARLAVPALGVDAIVNRYGVDRFGRLDVPQDTATVGWNPGYTELPGGGGQTFFAAHFELRGTPGVLYRLATLSPGDELLVSLTDGSTHRYRVTSAVDYPLGAIDMGALLQGREGVEGITLMTCSGPFSAGEYELRTVVLAERIEPGAG